MKIMMRDIEEEKFPELYNYIERALEIALGPFVADGIDFSLSVSRNFSSSNREYYHCELCATPASGPVRFVHHVDSYACGAVCIAIGEMARILNHIYKKQDDFRFSHKKKAL